MHFSCWCTAICHINERHEIYTTKTSQPVGSMNVVFLVSCLFHRKFYKHVAQVGRQHRLMWLLPNVLTRMTVLACAPIYDRLSFSFDSTANKKLFTAPFPLFCSVILCDIFASCDARSTDLSTFFATISGLIESNVAALHSIIKITKIMPPIHTRNIVKTLYVQKKQNITRIVSCPPPYMNMKPIH
jgi:hypothetical protein